MPPSLYRDADALHRKAYGSPRLFDRNFRLADYRKVSKKLFRKSYGYSLDELTSVLLHPLCDIGADFGVVDGLLDVIIFCGRRHVKMKFDSLSMLCTKCC